MHKIKQYKTTRHVFLTIYSVLTERSNFSGIVKLLHHEYVRASVYLNFLHNLLILVFSCHICGQLYEITFQRHL